MVGISQKNVVVGLLPVYTPLAEGIPFLSEFVSRAPGQAGIHWDSLARSDGSRDEGSSAERL